MESDTLEILTDSVSLDLNGKVYPLRGECTSDALSVQSEGFNPGVLNLESTSGIGRLITPGVNVGDAPFDRGNLLLDTKVVLGVLDDCTVGFEGGGNAFIGDAELNAGAILSWRRRTTPPGR